MVLNFTDLIMFVLNSGFAWKLLQAMLYCTLLYFKEDSTLYNLLPHRGFPIFFHYRIKNMLDSYILIG